MATRQPLEAVVYQTIQGNLPPSLEDLPADWRDDLAALQNLEDQSLWDVTRQSLPERQWRRHQSLLRKNQAGRLTPVEQAELEHLRADADRLALRRSFALAILKWRGYSLPVPSAR